MRVAYLDCFSGASGDMLLGAVLDAGINKEVFVSHLRSLGLPGFRLETGPVSKMGLRATQVRIEGARETSARRLEDIFELFKASSLPPPVVEKATAVFQRLAEAEGRIHQQLPRDVHFHELGAADSIVDIVGTALGFYLLEVERVYFSPLPLGRGMIKSEHGLLPNPAPATLELLKGVPLHPVDAEGELVTPTGAALLTTLGTFVPSPPRMSVQAIGYGAGSREFPWPNVLRLWLGEMEEPAAASSLFNWETVFLLETVIDDMDPEWFPHLQEKLASAGALDVWWTAVQMKKGRPGVDLTVLVRESDIPGLLRLILEESTTLGVRLRREQRFLLERREIAVETIHGSIKAKQAFLPSPEGGSWRIKPEFESCRRLAERRNLTLHEVYAAFWAAVQNLPLNDIF
ncbi:MAG: nickel pincer cofactor biosynthesis protein LarC [Syntrophomonadaceae bacterium]|nr:nickel pincer cofactor biosynthesis protein LarC [Syntrophomonadaceae bacterium]